MLSLVPLLACLSFSTPVASDWTAWRGSNASGVAKGSPPTEFSEKSNVKWKSALPGRGLSTPVIVGDRVFVTSAVSAPAEDAEDSENRGGRGPTPVGETEFLVLCFDRGDGSVIWDAVARTQVPHQGTHRDGSLAAPSIITDGEHLFVSFGSYGIYAYDLDGELKWEKDLGDMDVRNAFGEGSSPVLVGDQLVILWDHEGDSFLTALDKSTGTERWRTARELGTNWTTPLVVKQGSESHIVVASTPTIAYDARTGQPVWTSGESPAAPEEASARRDGAGPPPGGGRGARGEGRPGGGPPGGPPGRGGRGGSRGGIIATPILSEGVLVYSTGTRRGGTLFALRLEDIEEGSVEESGALLWTRDRDAPRIPSPIAHDGILYALKSTSGILSAFDLGSGAPLYEATRLKGAADVWASPVIAGDRIYILGRDGTIEVVATGPEFETLAVNKLEDGFDASPAVAGDELFLRGHTQLYCIAAGE